MAFSVCQFIKNDWFSFQQIRLELLAMHLSLQPFIFKGKKWGWGVVESKKIKRPRVKG
jgi:hypothetical protein